METTKPELPSKLELYSKISPYRINYKLRKIDCLNEIDEFFLKCLNNNLNFKDIIEITLLSEYIIKKSVDKFILIKFYDDKGITEKGKKYLAEIDYINKLNSEENVVYYEHLFNKVYANTQDNFENYKIKDKVFDVIDYKKFRNTLIKHLSENWSFQTQKLNYERKLFFNHYSPRYNQNCLIKKIKLTVNTSDFLSIFKNYYCISHSTYNLNFNEKEDITLSRKVYIFKWKKILEDRNNNSVIWLIFEPFSESWWIPDKIFIEPKKIYKIESDNSILNTAKNYKKNILDYYIKILYERKLKDIMLSEYYIIIIYQ